MRLSRFMKESILSRRMDWNYDDILNDLSRIQGNAPVLWKGWGKPPEAFVGREQAYAASGRIVKVGNDRGEADFRGSHLKPETIPVLVKKLGLDSPPIFTTRSYIQAIFFGNPYVFIPVGSYVTAYNPDVFDLIQVKDPEKLDAVIENYIFANNKMPPSNADGEVIVSAKKYWLVSVGSLIGDTKGKLKTFRRTDDVKTYSDVKEVIVNYLKFRKWVLYQSLQTALDPIARLKEYEGMGYPKEWIMDWKRRMNL